MEAQSEGKHLIFLLILMLDHAVTFDLEISEKK